MRITVLSPHAGDSGEQTLYLEAGSTVARAVSLVCGSPDEERWKVRRNGSKVETFTEPLADGDRLTITPRKIKGN